MRVIFKRYCFFVLLLFIKVQFSFAQTSEIKRTWHWYFGYQAGLDFSSGNPVVVTNGVMNAKEGCASISDTAGNLLFYTSGDTVWNRSHQSMPNGTGLLGCQSSTQSVIIVPKPNDSLIYYVFTNDCEENFDSIGLRFSIVDLSLDGGLGDVTIKNVLLLAPSSEHLAAVQGNSCNDVWIVSHDLTGNSYYAYHITSIGINTLPVITSIGDPNWPAFNGFYWGAIGYYKFSNDGAKLLAIRYLPGGGGGVYNPNLYKTAELFDFDNSTGVLSNYIGLCTDSMLYGGSFSPDNSKIYLGRFNDIIQYDLSSGIPDTIINSRNMAHTGMPGESYWAAQCALNGKIYFVLSYTGINDTIISVINFPNLYGTACDFVVAGLDLGGRHNGLGFPNYIENYFDSTSCTTGIFENNNKLFDGISVYPNPFNFTTTIKIKNESLKHNEINNIDLIDIFGRIQKFKYNISLNNGELKIDRGTLSNGIYALKIQIRNKIYSKKLIIAN